MQAAFRADEQPAIEQGGKGDEQPGFDEKLQLRIDHHDGCRAEDENQPCLHQHVKRIEAHDRRGEDAIIGDRLEQYGGDRDGIGHQQKRQKLDAAKRQHEAPASLCAERHEGGHGDERECRKHEQNGFCAPFGVFLTHGGVSAAGDKGTARCR
ncbi:hypothetical protein D3C86_1535230 [compost metagenome]